MPNKFINKVHPDLLAQCNEWDVIGLTGWTPEYVRSLGNGYIVGLLSYHALKGTS